MKIIDEGTFKKGEAPPLTQEEKSRSRLKAFDVNLCDQIANELYNNLN